MQQDFREYPPMLRHAISVARRLQDPLIEFCQLCNPDEDILAIKYHPLQVSIAEVYHESMIKIYTNSLNTNLHMTAYQSIL